MWDQDGREDTYCVLERVSCVESVSWSEGVYEGVNVDLGGKGEGG